MIAFRPLVPATLTVPSEPFEETALALAADVLLSIFTVLTLKALRIAVSLCCCAIAAAAATATSPPAGLTADEITAGWLALFDGETLFGWEPTSQANWRVKDGVIEVTEGEPGLLCTTTQFADYELRLDFRFAKGTNSGVFLHVEPGKRWITTDALTPDWKPAGQPFMVATVELTPTADGKTEYVATAHHWNAETMKQHEAMGFHEGWGACADQLVALCEAD